MHEFLNKSDDIAVFITRPAFVILPLLIDSERGAVIVVEGTKSFEGSARRPQLDIVADDGDDVTRFLHLLGQGCPVFGQGTPTGKRPPDATRTEETRPHMDIGISPAIGKQLSRAEWVRKTLGEAVASWVWSSR